MVWNSLREYVYPFSRCHFFLSEHPPVPSPNLGEDKEVRGRSWWSLEV